MARRKVVRYPLAVLLAHMGIPLLTEQDGQRLTALFGAGWAEVAAQAVAEAGGTSPQGVPALSLSVAFGYKLREMLDRILSPEGLSRPVQAHDLCPSTAPRKRARKGTPHVEPAAGADDSH